MESESATASSSTAEAKPEVAEPVVEEKPVEKAASDEKPAEEKPADAPAPVEERTKEIEEVTKVVDQFDNMTIFGNKSLNELHKIQSKKSHLSAGIDFTDPSLKM